MLIPNKHDRYWVFQQSFKGKKPAQSVYSRWRYLAAYWKISACAKQRLEWLIFYYTVGKKNALTTSAYFGIAPKTFHKWKKRFDPAHIQSLEERSRAPKKKRSWQVTAEEEADIIKLRKDNLELGKKKLKVIYKRDWGKSISTWKIERVIRKHKLYPEPTKHYTTKPESKPKLRINQVKDAIADIRQFGMLWHIDAVIIWWYGTRRIIFTALEDITKIAFARVYRSNTSGYAEDFLNRLMYLAQGRVNLMHSDNGSEFAGAFEKACQTLEIIQVYSRPRTPKDNPALEKFNDTVQREWLARSDVGLDDIDEANKDLTKWLVKYVSYRPHESLEYQTPLEYAQEQFFKVLPMWSARSHH